MRFVGCCGGLDDSWVKRDPPHQRQFRRVRQPFQIRGLNQSGCVRRKVGERRPGIAKNRLRAGVTILDVEHRIVARLLQHLGEVELEHRVVFTEQHHEANGVTADFIHDLAQGHELPRPL